MIRHKRTTTSTQILRIRRTMNKRRLQNSINQGYNPAEAIYRAIVLDTAFWNKQTKKLQTHPRMAKTFRRIQKRSITTKAKRRNERTNKNIRDIDLDW